MENMADLRPCPFCGGNAELKTYRDKLRGDTFVAMCQKTDCPGRTYRKRATLKAAIEAWNRRAEPENRALLAAEDDGGRNGECSLGGMKMTINEYQHLAMRTSNSVPHDRLLNGCLGLAGESGEVCDHVKKALFQGHELDKKHLIEEAGDVCWYLAELATGMGVSLESIMKKNIEKLMLRYPQGFDPERSKHREE